MDAQPLPPAISPQPAPLGSRYRRGRGGACVTGSGNPPSLGTNTLSRPGHPASPTQDGASAPGGCALMRAPRPCLARGRSRKRRGASRKGRGGRAAAGRRGGRRYRGAAACPSPWGGSGAGPATAARSARPPGPAALSRTGQPALLSAPLPRGPAAGDAPGLPGQHLRPPSGALSILPVPSLLFSSPARAEAASG